jgi:hypothetical protein
MKQFLLLAMAAFGLATAQTVIPPAAESGVEPVEADILVAKEGASWPGAPKSDSTKAKHPVAYAPRQAKPLGYGYVTPYRDQTRPRRVKYGKSRWVVLS